MFDRLTLRLWFWLLLRIARAVEAVARAYGPTMDWLWPLAPVTRDCANCGLVLPHRRVRYALWHVWLLAEPHDGPCGLRCVGGVRDRATMLSRVALLHRPRGLCPRCPASTDPIGDVATSVSR